MTSTDGGRMMDSSSVQPENAPKAIYQHSDGNANVTERRHPQLPKAEFWICLTEEGIVIAVSELMHENTAELNSQREEPCSK
jgi:hypothetical protein